MLSLAASAPLTAVPVVGPVLAAVSSVADMFGMSLLGPSFAKQNAQFGQALQSGIASGRINPRFAVNTNVRAIGARGASGLLASEAAQPIGGNVGFLSGLGKIFGGVTAAGGVVARGISDVRAIGSSIGAAIHPAASAAGKAATVAIDTATSAVKAHPVIAAAGAAAAVGAAAGAMGSSATMGKGGKMHPAVARALGLHKHRRMHATNTKALHRALRRVKGFERVARRVMSITHHRPVKMHFKFRKKRAA
jgi:hypothetical protein